MALSLLNLIEKDPLFFPGKKKFQKIMIRERVNRISASLFKREGDGYGIALRKRMLGANIGVKVFAGGRLMA